MTKDEAMKLALDALKRSMEAGMTGIKVDQAIAALRQALEQPECNPHPDAPHGFNRESSHSLGRYVCDCEGWEPEREWQGLTDEEPEACIVGIKGSAYDPIDTKRAYTYANQPGNVVAYKLGRASSSASLQRAGDFIDSGLILLKELQVEGYGVFDIGAEYTAPPSKPWVSLTDEEIAEGAKQSWVDKQAFESAVWWAEKKLREKNGF